jgi:hypothetical protein
MGDALAATIDWTAILDGADEAHRITPGMDLPREYCRIGPP